MNTGRLFSILREIDMRKTSKEIPIVLFVYNRAEHTQDVLKYLTNFLKSNSK